METLLSRTRTCYHSDVALFEPLFKALNDADVRYVVVGGVAVVLHGFARLTVDVDLVVDLAPEQALKTIDVLTDLGLRPRVPVDAKEFASRDKRGEWVREKNMSVFTMLDPANPMRQVDLFVEPPIDFAALWSRAETVELEHTQVRVACLADLIEMKQIAGRPQDLADVEALCKLSERRKDE